MKLKFVLPMVIAALAVGLLASRWFALPKTQFVVSHDEVLRSELIARMQQLSSRFEQVHTLIRNNEKSFDTTVQSDPMLSVRLERMEQSIQQLQTTVQSLAADLNYAEASGRRVQPMLTEKESDMPALPPLPPLPSVDELGSTGPVDLAGSPMIWFGQLPEPIRQQAEKALRYSYAWARDELALESNGERPDPARIREVLRESREAMKIELRSKLSEEEFEAVEQVLWPATARAPLPGGVSLDGVQ